jgi:hypothetical protein
MANPAQDSDFVYLETLPRPPTEPQSATRQLGLDLFDSDDEARRHPFQDDREGLAMGFPGGEITKHAKKVT